MNDQRRVNQATREGMSFCATFEVVEGRMVKGRTLLLALILLGWLTAAFSPSRVWGQETYIEPGVTIQVFVWGLEEDLSREVRVRRDGKFFFPWAGEVEAAGKTYKEVEEALRSQLSVYFRNFGVTVVPVDPKPVISVMGEVGGVGPVELVPGMTLLQALSAAGGLKPTATKLAKIFKTDQRVVEADLKALFEGDLSQNLRLEPGDVVYVPPVGLLPIVILGQVAKPGPTAVRPGATIAEAILAAGGFVTITQAQQGLFQQRAAGLYEVAIMREGKRVARTLLDAQTLQSAQTNPEAEEGTDPLPTEKPLQVMEGDTLIVREIREAVVLLGEVKQPGTYEVSGHSTLTSLIGQAGGFGENPNLRQVKVIRMVEGEARVITVDLIQVLQKGETERDIELAHRDLIYIPPRTRRVTWEAMLDKLSRAFLPASVIQAFRDIL